MINSNQNYMHHNYANFMREIKDKNRNIMKTKGLGLGD